MQTATQYFSQMVAGKTSRVFHVLLKNSLVMIILCHMTVVMDVNWIMILILTNYCNF